VIRGARSFSVRCCCSVWHRAMMRRRLPGCKRGCATSCRRFSHVTGTKCCCLICSMGVQMRWLTHGHTTHRRQHATLHVFSSRLDYGPLITRRARYVPSKAGRNGQAISRLCSVALRIQMKADIQKNRFCCSILLFDRAAGILPSRPWCSHAIARRCGQGRPSFRH
jgi:hypothetical protein